MLSNQNKSLLKRRKGQYIVIFVIYMWEMFSTFVVFSIFVSCFGNEYIKYHPKELKAKPKWPQKFYIEGTLFLPYAELVEPFTTWYDGVNHLSRVDMYGGMIEYFLFCFLHNIPDFLITCTLIIILSNLLDVRIFSWLPTTSIP